MTKITDMEEWKPVPNYPSYEVSSKGRVRNVDRGRMLTPWDNACKRRRSDKCICLYKDGKRKTFYISKLVALVFNGEQPPNTDVHHKNYDNEDNSPENLEYLDTSENRADHPCTANAKPV